MEATIDFETRSVCDLKKHGLFRYVEHPTTDAMMLGVMVDDEEPRIWVHPYFREILCRADYLPALQKIELSTAELLDIVQKADKIIAQNSMFEFCMWNVVCHKKYGFPKIPLEKFHDTMAQLAYHALPQNLGKAAKALRLKIQKNMDGHKAMLKLCKPKSLEPLIWNEDPALIWTELLYCLDDCRAERLIYKMLPKLPEKEREIWLWNERVNLRGIPCDLESAKVWADAVDDDKVELLTEFRKLCRNEVSGPRSYVKLKEWVNKECGLNLDSIGKEQTKDLLENEGLPAHVRRILEIKTEAGKASAAKLKAMIDRANADGRVRGCFAYHGASTGRFAARAIQPQNLPRDSFKPRDYEFALSAYKNGGKQALMALYDMPSFVASRSVRGTIMAPPGYVFVCSDYSSIESMDLAYRAGEEWKVEAFRRGECAYKHCAARILGKPYDQITDEERQSPGKISDLSGGYQGAAGAVRKFDAMVGVSDAEIVRTITQPWRDAHPMIVAFWRGIEDAAMSAVREPGKVFSYREVQFASDRVFLRMRLPSGRCLHYFQPGVEKRFIRKNERPADHPENCECSECGWWADNIYYWGMKQVDGKTTTQFTKVYTYGGKLTENCLAGSSEVLTPYGWKRLDQYREGDLLWDGEDFVYGGKLLDRGKQSVMLYKGLWITPDHRILCNDKKWRTAHEIASSHKGSYRPEVPALNDNRPRIFEERETLLARLMRLRKYYRSRGRRINAISGAFAKVLRVCDQRTYWEGEYNPRNDKASGLRGMARSYGSVPVADTSGLGELRGPRYSGLQRVGVLRGLLGRYGAYLQNRPHHRPERGERELRKIELPMGYLSGTSEQPQTESHYPNRVGSSDGSPGGEKIRRRRNYDSLPHKIRMAIRKVAYQTGLIKTCNVYDITNVGPRSRFVVRAFQGATPIIVHNCVQADCRDAMCAGATRVEKAGFPVVMTVHDEVVSLVRESDVRHDTLEVFEGLLSEVPNYMAGLPLIAKKGWIGKRYRK